MSRRFHGGFEEGEPPTLAEQHAALDLAKKYDWAGLEATLAASSSPKALVNAQPSGRWAALHQAAHRGRADVVRMLLRFGADPLAPTRDGRTARELARDQVVCALLQEAETRIEMERWAEVERQREAEIQRQLAEEQLEWERQEQEEREIAEYERQLAQERQRRAEIQRQLAEEQLEWERQEQEERELVHTYSITTPAPAGIRRPGGASVDPFVADREFFSVGGGVGGGACGGAAASHGDVLDQGRSKTCVRYALAGAIKDNLVARMQGPPRHAAEFDMACQVGIVDALCNSVRKMDADCCWPTEFDNVELNIRDTKRDRYVVCISIVENHTMNEQALAGVDPLDHSKVSKTNVISYDCGAVHEGQTHGRHCIRLDDCNLDAQEWIGTNSWGSQDPHPNIGFRGCNVAIYDVVVTSCLMLRGSSGLTENMPLWPRCKNGCGNSATPGTTDSGTPYDTCCRACAVRHGHLDEHEHDAECVARQRQFQTYAQAQPELEPEPEGEDSWYDEDEDADEQDEDIEPEPEGEDSWYDEDEDVDEEDEDTWYDEDEDVDEEGGGGAAAVAAALAELQQQQAQEELQLQQRLQQLQQQLQQQQQQQAQQQQQQAQQQQLLVGLLVAGALR
eukprot:COSAG02_NODE_2951_length_7674_cov_3.531881_7_plen_622_part_00